MKFGVIIFPGSSGDRDMIHVLEHVMNQEVIGIWHKETELSGFETKDCIVLPAGPSYEDPAGAAAIIRSSPVVEAVVRFAEAGGYVLGISGGFQLLCEAGLLPGTLLQNEKQLFICKDLHLSVMTRKSALTSKLLDLEIPLKLPVAHGNGCYHASENVLDELEINEQVLFKYCTEGGEIISEANPNGSARNIAGICNHSRNVLGIMPCPERAAEGDLGNTEGKILFESIIETLHTVEAV